MNKFIEPDYCKDAYCGRLGGHVKDVHKPYIFMFPKCKRPRRVNVNIMTYAGCIGSNGHYYVHIKEEINAVWSDSDGGWCWQVPWKSYEIKEMQGRDWEKKFDNINIALKAIEKKLKEWKVLNNRKYKIVWNNEEAYAGRVADKYRKIFNKLLKGD
jgi:hypothetical protein